MPKTIVLTILGAGLSTILAGIKIWEAYRGCKRKLVSYLFAGNAETGDKITLHNFSKSALMIEHWELLWVTRKFFLLKKIAPIHIFNYENGQLDLPANSAQSLILRVNTISIGILRLKITSGCLLNLGLPVEKDS